jgi:hypothetical protein
MDRSRHDRGIDHYPYVHSSPTEGAGYGQYPPDGTQVNRPGLVQAVDGRPLVSTGVGVTLVVAGAILRFAVTSRIAYGLNARVAGVIVMLAGVLALLLSLLVWGPLSRRRNGTVLLSPGDEAHGSAGCAGGRASSPGNGVY